MWRSLLQEAMESKNNFVRTHERVQHRWGTSTGREALCLRHQEPYFEWIWSVWAQNSHYSHIAGNYWPVCQLLIQNVIKRFLTNSLTLFFSAIVLLYNKLSKCERKKKPITFPHTASLENKPPCCLVFCGWQWVRTLSTATQSCMIITKHNVYITDASQLSGQRTRNVVLLLALSRYRNGGYVGNKACHCSIYNLKTMATSEVIRLNILWYFTRSEDKKVN